MQYSKKSATAALLKNRHIFGLDFGRAEAVDRGVIGYVEPLADSRNGALILGSPPDNQSFGLGRSHW